MGGRGPSQPLPVVRGGSSPLQRGKYCGSFVLPMRSFDLCRGHHVCGMVKSPLACLKPGSDEVTQVVNLDSLAQGSSEPDVFWAHFLIEAWTALEGERESLELAKEAPTVEDLMGRIKFLRPKVRFTSTLQCLIAVFILFL